MMDKGVFGVALVALLFTFSVSAAAQQPKKAARIGYLTLGSAPAEPEVEFNQRLRDLGWLEGRNLTIEYRWAANAVDRLPTLAKELVDLKVDVIVASATPAIQAAKKLDGIDSHCDGGGCRPGGERVCR
jgi:putative ABC transport system substrate-binding protein